MTGKTHMLGGLAAGTGIVILVNQFMPEGSMELAAAGAFMASSTMTALLPDVDEKNSMAGRRLIAIPITLFLIKVFLFLSELVSIGNVKKKIKECRKALNHRGIFHWLITWIMLSIILLIVGAALFFILHKTEEGIMALKLVLPLLLGFIPGYVSHLLLDIISGRIQLFAPFSKKWYGVPIFKVGGFLELYITRPLLAGATALALFYFM